MERAYLCLLSNICGGGYEDWEEFVELLEGWELDGSDVVEEARRECDKININSLFVALFKSHAKDIKDIIIELLNELENSDCAVVDTDIVEDYEVEIAENYKATTYDDNYDVWGAKDENDLLTFYKLELIDFLTETGAVKLDVFGLDREENGDLLRDALYGFLKEKSYSAFDEAVENYLREKK